MMEEMEIVNVEETQEPETAIVVYQPAEEPEVESGSTAATVGILAGTVALIGGVAYAVKKWVAPWAKDKMAEHKCAKAAAAEARKAYRDSKKAAPVVVEVTPAEPVSDSAPVEQPAE